MSRRFFGLAILALRFFFFMGCPVGRRYDCVPHRRLGRCPHWNGHGFVLTEFGAPVEWMPCAAEFTQRIFHRFPLKCRLSALPSLLRRLSRRDVHPPLAFAVFPWQALPDPGEVRGKVAGGMGSDYAMSKIFDRSKVMEPVDASLKKPVRNHDGEGEHQDTLQRAPPA
jgi:hypothetical protein